MSYLLDTNIVSETIKKEANKVVISWLQSFDITYFHLSVLTLGEIRKGVEKLSDARKKQNIVRWLEIDLITKFSSRIIDIDKEVGDKWGYISAQSNVPAIDGLIAASALVHNLKLVTRNTKDFINIQGLELINPWG